MAEIRLGRSGQVAIVDDEDFERLSQLPWWLGGGGYAFHRDAEGNMRLMHRDVLGLLPGVVVDHINGNKLDNRKANLRPCTHRENTMNRGKNKNNRSGYKGVALIRETGKWRSAIKLHGKVKWLGNYATKEEAARAYNLAAKEHFGEFAHLNDVPDGPINRPPRRKPYQKRTPKVADGA